MKEVTLEQYLMNESDKKIKFLLTAYYLKNVSVELFFKEFEEVERTPAAVKEFLMDLDNGYNLALFGSRACHEFDYDNAYNGKSNYQGVICTLGATHSNR